MLSLTNVYRHSKIPAAQSGEVAQWQSSGLISRWLWVQVPLSPHRLFFYRSAPPFQARKAKNNGISALARFSAFALGPEVTRL